MQTQLLPLTGIQLLQKIIKAHKMTLRQLQKGHKVTVSIRILGPAVCLNVWINDEAKNNKSFCKQTYTIRRFLQDFQQIL